MAMENSRRNTPSRSRFRLRASGSRTIAFRVSHSRPTWAPPSKEEDEAVLQPVKKGKRRS
jgi:hypothetical protein